jgi:dephospho-CoA kinase
MMTHSVQMASRPAVVAIVGMSGTGKSLAVQHIQKKYSACVVYFGGVVIEELHTRGMPVTEENEAKVRFELRKTLGMAAMAVKRFPQIENAFQSGKDVVIDGLYSYSEYSFLRDRLAEHLLLIAVHAPKHIRLQRLLKRAIRPLSPDEVELRDKREIEDLEKGGPIAIADYHVLNSDSQDQLFHDLDAIIADTGLFHSKGAREAS